MLRAIKTIILNFSPKYSIFFSSNGLKTAPQTFKRILNGIFSDTLYNWFIIYNDGLIVWSDNETEALQHYDQVFRRAIDFGIQFKPTKCAFFFTRGFTGFRTPVLPQQVGFNLKGYRSHFRHALVPKMCRVSRDFLAWLDIFVIMCKTCPTVPSIFVHSYEKALHLCGLQHMRLNSLISKRPSCLLRPCFIIQIGVALLNCTRMQVSMVSEPYWPKCIMANSVQLNLHLAHLLALNHVGLQLTKSYLPSSGVQNILGLTF